MAHRLLRRRAGALRALPPAGARRITAVLHSPPVRFAVHPVSAAGHWLMAAHFLLSGCLFAHAVAELLLAVALVTTWRPERRGGARERSRTAASL